MSSPWKLRPATLNDRGAISALIVESARHLSRDDYSDAQIDAAIQFVYGVDSDLIRDGTYFAVERDGALIGCGGWSKRRTLFGGDQYASRDTGFLDPQTDPAKIRAFFVHPDAARQGVGRAILDACEQAARAEGFKSLELMATLPGLKLYRACGFVGEARVTHTAPNGVTLPFVPMKKAL
jgi:GNAT superfamily N-acetyltransferase